MNLKQHQIKFANGVKENIMTKPTLHTTARLFRKKFLIEFLFERLFSATFVHVIVEIVQDSTIVYSYLRTTPLINKPKIP